MVADENNTDRTARPSASDHSPSRPHSRWTPAKIFVSVVLVVCVVLPLGYLVARELTTTFSATAPLASAQSGAADGAPTGSGTRNTTAPLEQFNTSNLQVERDRIRSGGPPKDGIPSLTDPEFITAERADYLDETARVVSVTINGQTRAYPLNILNWHEAVNDTVGDVPIGVIYCPLCDSVSVVDRRLNGATYEFGISGLLMNSNVLLYDRTDDALWSQVKLTAISGPNAGQALRHLDGWAIVPFGQWRQNHPEGQVLSADTGHGRDYQRNPYGRYFNNERLMFPVSPEDDRYPNKMRIIGVKLGDAVRAYPLQQVRRAPDATLTDTIAGQRLVLRAEGKAGTVRVVDAPEKARVVHTFWFAWYAFHPDTEVFGEG